MPRLVVRLLKPDFHPIDARDVERGFHLALVDFFGSEDSAGFAKWAHDYTMGQFGRFPTGMDEADQVVRNWREALTHAQCGAFSEWMRCAPAPQFEIELVG